MGICCSRPEIPKNSPPEEQAIVYYQDLLKFHHNTVETVATVISANSSNNLVSPDQFNTIGVALNLNLAEIDSIDSMVFKFYRNFISKGSSYDARKLTLLGTLLGKGSLKVKLGLYFNCIPGVEDNAASDIGVKSVLEDLVKISVDFLPQLAVEDAAVEGQSLSREQYDIYKEKLLSGKEALISRFMTAFMGTSRSVRKEKFIEEADEHAALAKSLGSAVLLRNEMLTEAANVQKGAAFKQAFQGFSTTLTAGQKK